MSAFITILFDCCMVNMSTLFENIKTNGAIYLAQEDMLFERNIQYSSFIVLNVLLSELKNKTIIHFIFADKFIYNG